MGMYVDIAKLLIESGMDTSVKYSGEVMKQTDALAFARKMGQTDIVHLLNANNENEIDNTSAAELNSHDEIIKHVSEFLGEAKKTISEIVPGSRVAVNIHIIPSSNERDFVTLFTTGMSDLPMDNSDEANDFKYAELLLKLPSNWTINKEAMKDPNHYWPLGWLRKTAHIPHMYDGWLTDGVILPNGEPPQPFSANTKLSCMMVCNPQEQGLKNLLDTQGRLIHFYSLVPIFEEERKLALEKGCDYLIGLLIEKGITDVLDINRENVSMT